VSATVQHDLKEDTHPGGSTTAVEEPRRKRGRPLEMTPPQVLDRIRRLSASGDGLYRIHHTNSDLYARARRQFGSWAAAVAASGVDYAGAVSAARRRASETRRARRSSETHDR
jgi:hypothetical protein